MDQYDRGSLTELGSPVLGSQAADAGVSPAVAAANRAGGGAHAGTVEPTELPRDRVAPQPVTAGEDDTAPLPADITLPGRAHHAAAASVLHLPVVTGLWCGRAVRGFTDLRTSLSFSQQTCVSCGAEDGEESHKLHHDLKSDRTVFLCGLCRCNYDVPMLVSILMKFIHTPPNKELIAFYSLYHWLRANNYFLVAAR